MISDNTDTKKLWSHIRSKNKDVGISDLESGTTLIQDAETKANMFSSLRYSPSPTSTLAPPPPKSSPNAENPN